jgi:hypothetical protein
MMENMCHYETLYYENNTGYVVRCTECKNVQIGYGNLLLTFTVNDFKSFKSWIGKVKSGSNQTENESLRNIILPVPCEGVRFVLSMQELMELDVMLEAADSELMMLDLLQMFDGI